MIESFLHIKNKIEIHPTWRLNLKFATNFIMEIQLNIYLFKNGNVNMNKYIYVYKTRISLNKVMAFHKKLSKISILFYHILSIFYNKNKDETNNSKGAFQ